MSESPRVALKEQHYYVFNNVWRLDLFHHQPVTQNVSDTAVDLTSVLWFNKVVIDA